MSIFGYELTAANPKVAGEYFLSYFSSKVAYSDNKYFKRVKAISYIIYITG